MLQEFQVLYRAEECGPIHSTIVRAATEEEARQLIVECGATPRTVGPGFPVIDWNKPAFTRDEAAVFLNCGTTHFYNLQVARRNPRQVGKAHPLFRKADLEAYRASLMEGEAA